MLQLNIKAIFLANILVMKEDRVKVKCIWIAEIGFTVLNQLILTCTHSLTRDY